jgi:hypothetical protein
MKFRVLFMLLPFLMMLAACDDDDPAGPNDVTSPAKVTNLAVISTGDSSFTLQWKAPGDDGGAGTAASYQIRWSHTTITTANFGSANVVPNPPAPAAGGTTQQFTVTELDTMRVTHFALRATDEAGNVSAVSNDAASADVLPPSQVTDLEVIDAPTSSSLTIRWTAPSDNSGKAVFYEIRRSSQPILSMLDFVAATLVPGPPVPANGGVVQQFTVPGVDTTQVTHFALISKDAADNISALSNDAQWGADPVTVMVDIPPFRDNTMYEEGDTLSNGAGAYLFTGTTNGLNTGGIGKIRRALLAFAVSDSIPAGAVIDSVVLTVHISKIPNIIARVTSLHRVTTDWGEGASDAGNPGGQGALAETNDATWTHRFFDTTSWTTAGGDFDATVSAQTNFATNNSFPAWTSPRMVSDVQSWLDTPATNFGWIVIGEEPTQQSAKRFDSRENANAANRPRLRVFYTVVP